MKGKKTLVLATAVGAVGYIGLMKANEHEGYREKVAEILVNHKGDNYAVSIDTVTAPRKLFRGACNIHGLEGQIIKNESDIDGNDVRVMYKIIDPGSDGLWHRDDKIVTQTYDDSTKAGAFDDLIREATMDMRSARAIDFRTNESMDVQADKMSPDSKRVYDEQMQWAKSVYNAALDSYRVGSSLSKIEEQRAKAKQQEQIRRQRDKRDSSLLKRAAQPGRR